MNLSHHISLYYYSSCVCVFCVIVQELTAREQAKFEAAQEMAQRLTSGSKKSQTSSRSAVPFAFKQPTADEAKRIAKIFSAKF